MQGWFGCRGSGFRVTGLEGFGVCSRVLVRLP